MHADLTTPQRKRIDMMLLDNILVLVEKLAQCRLGGPTAPRLVARLIFMTNFEDRKIVGETYRARREVRSLYYLIIERNHTGLRKLTRHPFGF